MTFVLASSLVLLTVARRIVDGPHAHAATDKAVHTVMDSHLRDGEDDDDEAACDGGGSSCADTNVAAFSTCPRGDSRVGDDAETVDFP